MERQDIQTQVDELRGRIEELRGKMNDTLSSLKDIRSMLAQSQREARARSNEARVQMSQVTSRARERVPGGNLLIVAGLLAVATTAVAFVLFAPHTMNRIGAVIGGRMRTILLRWR